MKQKFLFLGVVEKDDKTYFLLDLNKKSFKKYSKIIVKHNTYNDNGSKRFLSLLPIEITNYGKFKENMVSSFKKLKRHRLVNLTKTSYILNDEKIGMNIRKPLIEYFLKNQKFLDFVYENTKSNKKVLMFVTEQAINDFVLSEKSRLYKKLENIKKGLYKKDRIWIKFLKKHNLSITVVLPTYNEVNFEKNVQIVHKLKEIGLFNELIITDGFSTKHDPASIKLKLIKKGINLDFTIIRQNGLGKGGAIEAAVKYSMLNNHDFVICVDSDNLPTIRRVYPNAPINMNIEFFIRKFIQSYIRVVKNKGITNSKKVFFKSSYLRMPQLKKSLDLRYGLATTIVKDFFKRYVHSNKNLYPLSGEVAFNPKFFLENLNLTKNLLTSINLPKEQYCGINIPSGFCLENFWNGTIDTEHHFVYYVNMLLHHHGPVVKSTKRSIEDQRGEVMSGAVAGICKGLIKHNYIEHLFKKIPRDIIRSNKVIMECDPKIMNNKLIIDNYDLLT